VSEDNLLPILLPVVSHLMQFSLIKVCASFITRSSIYSALIGSPGSKKSIALRIVQSPFQELLQVLNIKISSHVVNNGTIEGIINSLKHGPKIALFEEDGNFFSGVGRDDPNGLNNERGYLCSLYETGPVYVRSLVKETIEIDRPKLDLFVHGHAIQFVKFCTEDKLYEKEGLSNRFIFVAPKNSIGENFDEDLVPNAKVSFICLFYVIYELNNCEHPVVYSFDEDACASFKLFQKLGEKIMTKDLDSYIRLVLFLLNSILVLN
jgi:hypothetical protein